MKKSQEIQMNNPGDLWERNDGILIYLTAGIDLILWKGSNQIFYGNGYLPSVLLAARWELNG